eukprot:scaffold1621_cov262-Chaetoceros_neogracile.AAC.8
MAFVSTATTTTTTVVVVDNRVCINYRPAVGSSFSRFIIKRLNTYLEEIIRPPHLVNTSQYISIRSGKRLTAYPLNDVSITSPNMANGNKSATFVGHLPYPLLLTAAMPAPLINPLTIFFEH